MWTDGSQNEHTNFATDSGLEGDHCCVKTGPGGWRGAACDQLLHGVCEARAPSHTSRVLHLTNLIQARVTRVLAHAPRLSLTSGRGLLAVRWVGDESSILFISRSAH